LASTIRHDAQKHDGGSGVSGKYEKNLRCQVDVMAAIYPAWQD